MLRETMQKFFQLADATVWRGERKVLDRFSLELQVGESVAILGPNGSGKSTLMQVITGDLSVAYAQLRVCRLFGEDQWSLEELRHRMGYVTPEQARHFDREEKAHDVVLSALRGAYGRTREMRFSQKEKRAAWTAMQITGVDRLADRSIHTLSSGEQRRLLIARAMVHQPEVLVMDEPTLGLDFGGSQRLIQILRKAMGQGTTVVLVTHHPEEIPPEIDRVILLKEGKIVADGKKRKVLDSVNLTCLYDTAVHVHWRDGWCHARVTDL